LFDDAYAEVAGEVTWLLLLEEEELDATEDEEEGVAGIVDLAGVLVFASLPELVVLLEEVEDEAGGGGGAGR